MTHPTTPTPPHLRNPFRAAVLRGLAVVLPPLMTIVIFLWIGATVGQYAIEPLISTTRWVVTSAIADVVTPRQLPAGEAGQPVVIHKGKAYSQTADGNYVPTYVLEHVKAEGGKRATPDTALAVYDRYVQLTYLRAYLAIPFFLSLFTIILYLLGKFMAAGAGRVFWNLFERGVSQVPLVRNVYNAVKQISDFVLAQQQIEFSRVVAVEWPRKGIWTLALVTGESLPDIEAAANEPVYSVLIPTSPMPMTGFTVTVKRSEVVDLNISFDQAIQFIISCGVAVSREEVQRLVGPPPSMSASARALLADSEDGTVNLSSRPMTMN